MKIIPGKDTRVHASCHVFTMSALLWLVTPAFKNLALGKIHNMEKSASMKRFLIASSVVAKMWKNPNVQNRGSLMLVGYSLRMCGQKQRGGSIGVIRKESHQEEGNGAEGTAQSPCVRAEEWGQCQPWEVPGRYTGEETALGARGDEKLRFVLYCR